MGRRPWSNLCWRVILAGKCANLGEATTVANQDPAEFIPAIAERGRPEHGRSFAGSLNESFLLVTAWSGGTVPEIAHVYCHDPGRPREAVFVLGTMDPGELEDASLVIAGSGPTLPAGQRPAGAPRGAAPGGSYGCVPGT